MASEIITYRDINDLHTATGFHEKTTNPYFHIFSTSTLHSGFLKQMPPYRQDFYQVGLNLDMTGTTFSVQSKQVFPLNNLLYTIVPGQILSWNVADVTNSYILYFKKEHLAFFRGDIEETFPFFKLTHPHFNTIPIEVSQELQEDIIKMRKTFVTPGPFQQEQLQALTLAFLFKCKAVFESLVTEPETSSKPPEILTRYLHLVNKYYTQHKSVEEYAALLHITPNYLSNVVRKAINRNAKCIIDERILTESKNLLTYTSLSVSEIAYKLCFSEPTHFIRFFKKETGTTPTEFRHTTPFKVYA